MRGQYAQGTEIRNTRQISIVSVEELAFIADSMGIDTLQPEWVGANLLVSGMLVELGKRPFEFFDFTVPGLVLALSGLAYVMFIAPRLLMTTPLLGSTSYAM